MTRARIAHFLAKIKASKKASRPCNGMEQPLVTPIRHQRMAGQEQRA
jgi:hypothetical protein